MCVFAYIAAAAIVALGVALLVAPVRATRALNEWYLVPPAIQPGQRIGLAVCRLIGLGLAAGGCALAVSTTYAISRAL